MVWIRIFSFLFMQCMLNDDPNYYEFSTCSYNICLSDD